MARHVTVDSLTAPEHANFKALSRVYSGQPQAARAIFRAGLEALRSKIPAPPSPAEVVTLDPPPPPAPAPEVVILDPEDEEDA